MISSKIVQKKYFKKTKTKDKSKR